MDGKMKEAEKDNVNRGLEKEDKRNACLAFSEKTVYVRKLKKENVTDPAMWDVLVLRIPEKDRSREALNDYKYIEANIARAYPKPNKRWPPTSITKVTSEPGIEGGYIEHKDEDLEKRIVKLATRAMIYSGTNILSEYIAIVEIITHNGTFQMRTPIREHSPGKSVMIVLEGKISYGFTSKDGVMHGAGAAQGNIVVRPDYMDFSARGEDAREIRVHWIHPDTEEFRKTYKMTEKFQRQMQKKTPPSSSSSSSYPSSTSVSSSASMLPSPAQLPLTSPASVSSTTTSTAASTAEHKQVTPSRRASVLEEILK
jgi:hypothetical protein